MPETPTVKRRDLGARLRRYRDAAGLTGEQVATALDRSTAWVSYIESGRSGIRPEMLNLLLDLYRVENVEVRQALLKLARSGRERGWWSRYASVLSKAYSSYIGHESAATRLRIYEAMVVHGLLQTEAYARTVIQVGNPELDAATVAQRAEVRLNRQQRLLGDSPLRLQVVLDEAVLHRVVGGDVDVHRGQLERLLAVGREYPHVRLQVVPFSHSVFPTQLASFTVLEFAELPEIVYIETLTGDLYEEPPESRRYSLAHDDLRAAALSDSASIELIETVLASLAPDTRGHHRAYETDPPEVGEEQPQ